MATFKLIQLIIHCGIFWMMASVVVSSNCFREQIADAIESSIELKQKVLACMELTEYNVMVDWQSTWPTSTQWSLIQQSSSCRDVASTLEHFILLSPVCSRDNELLRLKGIKFSQIVLLDSNIIDSSSSLRELQQTNSFGSSNSSPSTTGSGGGQPADGANMPGVNDVTSSSTLPRVLSCWICLVFLAAFW